MDVTLFVAAVGVGAGAVVVPAVVLLRRASRRLRTLAEVLSAVRYDAEHDCLTGLANRAAFYAAAAPAVAAAASACVVALVDLDGFKRVNDAYGHGVGDLVLHTVARRLRERVGDAGLVARLGGDEFAVLARPVEGETPYDFGRALVDAGDAPVEVADAALRLTWSAGVAPVHGPADLEVLLCQADRAMYRAKRTHLGVVVYEPVLDNAGPIVGGRPAMRIGDLAASPATVAGAEVSRR